MSNAQLKARLYLGCLLVLAAGWCAAALIYLTVEEPPPAGMNYIVVDGIAYPVAPQQTKRYVRELEQFGGKAAVLFDEFNRWFASLWRGKRLALTLASISTMTSIAVFLFAAWLPADVERRP